MAWDSIGTVASVTRLGIALSFSRLYLCNETKGEKRSCADR